MDVKYKYLKENTTLMIIDGEPFSEITRVKDNRLQILTADGEYFDGSLSVCVFINLL